MHLRCCVDESDLLVVLWLPLCSTRLSRTEPGSLLQKVYKQLLLEMSKMTKALHAKKKLRAVLFHVVLGTMDVSLTDGYPYIQVQLTGKLQKALAEFQ